MTANPLVASRWTAVLQRLGAKRAALAATLCGSAVLRVDERTLHVEVPRLSAFQKAQLEKEANNEMIVALIQTEFGRPLGICYHAPRESRPPVVQVRGTQDTDTVGGELARLLVAAPRAGRGARWGIRSEMLLAESAGEHEVLNDLLLAHRLLVQLGTLAERREASR